VDVVNIPWRGNDAVQYKVLWRDAKTGGATVLLRFAPGAQVRMHEHTGVEQTYVLAGSLEDHESKITAGNFAVRQPGSVHSAFSKEGSLHIAFFSAPNRIVGTGKFFGDF
jgi:anti-sigma factor ChrR (cupin superfamily)